MNIYKCSDVAAVRAGGKSRKDGKKSACCHAGCPYCSSGRISDVCGSVVTGSVDLIRANTAVIAGNTFSGFQIPVLAVGIEYSARPDFAERLFMNSPPEASYSIRIIGLSPGTTYYYRTIAHTHAICCPGKVKTFTTPTEPVVPVVLTGSVSGVGSTGAVVTENRYDGIPESISEVGVKYSTGLSLSDALTADGPVTTPYSAALSSLTPGTAYSFCAYVVANGAEFRGELKSFMTTGQAPAPDLKTSAEEEAEKEDPKESEGEACGEVLDSDGLDEAEPPEDFEPAGTEDA